MSKLNIVLIFILGFNMNFTFAAAKAGWKFQEKKVSSKSNFNKRDAFMKQFWL